VGPRVAHRLQRFGSFVCHSRLSKCRAGGMASRELRATRAAEEVGSLERVCARFAPNFGPGAGHQGWGLLPGTSTLFWPARMEVATPIFPGQRALFASIRPLCSRIARWIGAKATDPFSTKVLREAPGPDQGESVIPVRLRRGPACCREQPGAVPVGGRLHVRPTGQGRPHECRQRLGNIYQSAEADTNRPSLTERGAEGRCRCSGALLVNGSPCEAGET
jgi:hypothetical protein